MKKIITLTEREFNLLTIKKSKLKAKLKDENFDENTKPMIFGIIFLYIIYTWLFPRLLDGYEKFPIMTTITIGFSLLFYILGLSILWLVLKKIYMRNK